MRNNIVSSEDIIRGECFLFVCRNCRTKFGWEHQEWCEFYSVTQPLCKDCRYYRQRDDKCAHPSKKLRKGELPYEKAESSV